MRNDETMRILLAGAISDIDWFTAHGVSFDHAVSTWARSSCAGIAVHRAVFAHYGQTWPPQGRTLVRALTRAQSSAPGVSDATT
jgi:hypothetical protein